MKELFREVESHMKHALEHFHGELKHLRTGRASLSLLEGLTVDYYGSPVPLNQVANLSVADATLIVAQPYDPTQSSAIERAIRNSDLSVNPANDGTIIRIVLPELTEERRREYIKTARHKAEDGRVAIRNIRRHAKDTLNKMMKNGDAGEDEVHRAERELDDLTHTYEAQVDELLKNKEAELLEV